MSNAQALGGFSRNAEPVVALPVCNRSTYGGMRPFAHKPSAMPGSRMHVVAPLVCGDVSGKEYQIGLHDRRTGRVCDLAGKMQLPGRSQNRVQFHLTIVLGHNSRGLVKIVGRVGRRNAGRPAVHSIDKRPLSPSQ